MDTSHPASNVSGFIAQLVRASHRYREVTGSYPVEVLTFSGNCLNCVHNFFQAIASIAFITAMIIAYLKIVTVGPGRCTMYPTYMYVERITKKMKKT